MKTGIIIKLKFNHLGNVASVFNLISIVLLAIETFFNTVSIFFVVFSTGASSTTATSSLTSGAEAAIASPPAHDCKTSSTVFPEASARASADL